MKAIAAPLHPPTPPPTPPPGGRFPQTRWSLIVEARGENPEALASLCKQYWKPLFVYARRTGVSVTDAEDLTQSFFALLLSKDFFQRAQPEKGRLRSLLLHSFQNFIINVWKKTNAVKRGGRVEMIEIDATAKEWLDEEPATEGTPETEFERQWAREVLSQGKGKLRELYEAAGKMKEYEAFAELLEDGKSERSYKEIAEELGVKEPAARFIGFKFRQRFRKCLEEIVLETVISPEEAQEELAHLLKVFRSPPKG